MQAITTRADKGVATVAFAPRKGAYAPALQTYLCKVHGHRAKSVRIDGKILPAKAWGTGNDVYGAYTWVTARAGVAQKIVLQNP